MLSGFLGLVINAYGVGFDFAKHIGERQLCMPVHLGQLVMNREQKLSILLIMICINGLAGL